MPAASASAQWIVNDPVNTAVNSAVQAGQAANHIEVLRQWAAQLEQLNRQLRELEAQLAAGVPAEKLKSVETLLFNARLDIVVV